MNWYKTGQLNMVASPEVTKLASSISIMLIEADKGRIIDNASIHNIVSTIPSVPVLEQSVELALKMAGTVSGIVDTTPAREDVIRRINDTFMTVGKVNDIGEFNNDLAKENLDGDSEAQQVQ